MKQLATVGVLALMLATASSVQAIPTLQIDIDGGSYLGGSEESVVTDADSFTLYTLLSDTSLFDTTYYLSVALIDSDGNGIIESDPAPSLGSINVNGISYDVTGDMVYGNPPLDVLPDNKDLPSHGVYDTYYLELAFSFDPADTTCAYNVQDNAGGLVTGCSTEDMLYAAFDFDISGLLADYELHFDLYDVTLKRGDLVTGIFAPFSHDARTTSSVPEPSVFGLLLLGLAGIGLGKKARG